MSGKLIILTATIILLGSSNAMAACSVDQGMVNFGVYNPIVNSHTVVAGSVIVRCDLPQAISLKIGPGNSQNFSARKLIKDDSSNTAIVYNLYLDSGRTVVFGDGTDGTGYFSDTVQNKTINVFGLIPKLQPVPPGSYSDAINVSLEF